MIKAIFFDSAGVILKEGFKSGIAEYEKQNAIPSGQLYQAAHDFQYWKDFTLGKINEDEYWENVRKNFQGELDIKKVRKIIFDNFYVQQEVVEYARELEKKYTVGVITNNPKEWFGYFFEKSGIIDIFAVKAVSGYIRVRKPDIEIFRYALQQADVSGNESIYVDDKPEKVQGAESLGMNVIIYTNIGQLKKDIKSIISKSN